MLPDLNNNGSGKMITIAGVAIANILIFMATQLTNRPKQNVVYTTPPPVQPVYVNPAPVFQQPQPVVVQPPPIQTYQQPQQIIYPESRRFQTQPIYSQQQNYYQSQPQQVYYQPPQYQQPQYYDPYSQRCPYGYS